MRRISIDVTDQEHQMLTVMASMQGQTMKAFVISRTIGTGDVLELEALLDERLRQAESGAIVNRTVGEAFAEVYAEPCG